MSKTNINRKSIAIIQLQNDITSTSLITRAMSEVLAKTLFQHRDQALKTQNLLSKAAGLTGLPQIPAKVAGNGLEWLKNNGWVSEDSKGWILTKQGEDQITDRHKESEERLEYLIKKHFGEHIDKTILKSWFLSASTAFFAEFGEVISRALLREVVSLPDRTRLENILNHSIEEAKLTSEKDFLNKGFHQFLDDVDPKAEAQKMSFAVMALSARLISASSGPDPIILPEFEKSKLFLDTNVLLLESVEGQNPEMSLALVALAKALHSIGATLHIIKDTKDEYEGVITRKRTETLKVLHEGASISVLQKSGDRFLRMALKNEAKSEEDFIRFFDSIAHPPVLIGSVPITLLDFPELEKEISDAKKSGKKTEIIKEWKKLRGRDKNEILAEHDTALNAAVLFYRKEEGKGWVITRDKSMLNLSRRWHEKQGLPAWIYLQAVVEILAVYGAGPTYKPEDFAPLLGALIRSEVQETFANFQVEDLGELADIDARAFELSDEEVISFAQKIHQMRLSGDDSSADLQLHIKRTFQGRRLKDNVSAQEARAEVQDRERKIDIAKQIGIALATKGLIPVIRRRHLWRYIKSLLPYIIIGIGMIVGVIKIWEKPNTEGWKIALIIGLCVDVGIPILKKVFSGTQKESVEDEAKKEAETQWEKEKNLLK